MEGILLVLRIPVFWGIRNAKKNFCSQTINSEQVLTKAIFGTSKNLHEVRFALDVTSNFLTYYISNLISEAGTLTLIDAGWAHSDIYDAYVSSYREGQVELHIL